MSSSIGASWSRSTGVLCRHRALHGRTERLRCEIPPPDFKSRFEWTVGLTVWLNSQRSSSLSFQRRIPPKYTGGGKSASFRRRSIHMWLTSPYRSRTWRAFKNKVLGSSFSFSRRIDTAVTSKKEAQNPPRGYGRLPPVLPSRPIGSERSPGLGLALPSSQGGLDAWPVFSGRGRHRNRQTTTRSG
jgi:hypothetical protein